MTPSQPEPVQATLANGVRVIAMPMPHLRTASVSIFVRSGSAHETRRQSGIGHVVEHMVFKGTARRDSHQINLDAERLGAEVNAHTDKDHSAFHMRGLGGDAVRFVAMLADLVQQPTFPDEELERERQVLLQEVAEVEDDPMATAYKLFDGACYGLHPVAQPVIGSRANIERFTRDELAGWVRQQFTGANVLVAAAGGIDPQALVREVERALGDMPRGEPHRVAPPQFTGGLRARRVPGSSQTHVVLGFPIPTLVDDDPAAEVAAALLGEGMSSPLMTELRERRGLVYHAACAADVLTCAGSSSSKPRSRRTSSTSCCAPWPACCMRRPVRPTRSTWNARSTSWRCAACARKSGPAAAWKRPRWTGLRSAACAHPPSAASVRVP